MKPELIHATSQLSLQAMTWVGDQNIVNENWTKQWNGTQLYTVQFQIIASLTVKRNFHKKQLVAKNAMIRVFDYGENVQTAKENVRMEKKMKFVQFIMRMKLIQN